MIEIKLMADYQCYPLWYTDVFFCDDGTNINPHELKISEQLKIDLMAWASLYDETLNMDDPASSGFKTKQEEDVFKKEGSILAQRLQEELGNLYKIYLSV